MTKQYNITGMTCNGCRSSVQSKLAALEGVQHVAVDLSTGQATLEQTKNIPLTTLSDTLGSKYGISEVAPIAPLVKEPQEESTENTGFSWAAYQPLFLIVTYILGVCILVQYPFDEFSGSLLMRHFMAGFFLVFSFFKLLNIRGFADSYALYDLVAARWRGWGFIYPFVELGLGILYLTNSFPTYTNWITIVVLGVSSLGVIKSNLDKRTIKCACLGDVFNLPMSTITIVEDVAMVAMAAFMLF